MDAQALEVAKKSAETAGVAHLIRFERANAMKLPYEDASFDIVINEAMLTMTSRSSQKKMCNGISKGFKNLKVFS